MLCRRTRAYGHSMEHPALLYRFRRTEALIGEYKELERQEIYFSSPDELNDPVEGFKDMFWLGDEIIWKNFLKHYLLCLENVCETFLIDGENFLISPAIIPVLKTANDFPTEAYKKLYKDICDLFFKNAIAEKWPAILASRTTPVRQNELYAYLKSIHIHALNSIFTVYENFNLMPRRPDDDPLRRFEIKDVIGLSVNWANSKAENQDTEDAIERIFAEMKHKLSEDDLITLYNRPLNAIVQKNRRMLYGTFPEAYLKCLERLVHPEWYTATFTTSCNNPSMWGHYGDEHKGVCLIFKAGQIDTNPHLRLYGINGIGGAKNNLQPSYGYSDRQFYKIKYAEKYPEIDFFRSLGALPMPALNTGWYANEFKNRSTCADAIYDDEEIWRKNYWDVFYETITTKVKDWAYEDEYRLIYAPMIMDFRDKPARKMKYQWSDLEGIVFGIRTPEDTKTKIISIVDEKCISEKIKDFNFYQAIYSKKDGKIDTVKVPISFQVD
jgi:hypothetical protein